MTTTAPEIDEKDAELVEAEESEAEEFGAEVDDDEEESDSNPAGEFSLVLIDEKNPTVDGRYFVPDKVTWRDPPIPLLFTTTNGNGHKGGEVGGAITKIWREDGKIKGSGHFESGEKGQELRRLITEGVLTGVSADVGGAMVELEAATETTKEMQRITEGKILGVTALPLQAYDDTRIAVTAAAIPAAPPKSWFENPGLKKVTPISVTADGRVYGHVAAWGTCHVGFNRPGECLTPPHSASNYAHFTIGEVLTAEGDTVPTGPITLGTGHAGLTLNANAARDHYDNTGTAVADVTAGEDQFGIWVSGAMRPSVTDEKIREFRASAPSGDWRSIGGTLEMVGVLAVNVPGFPIPRAKVEFADEEPLSLVAAGVVPIEEFVEDCGCEEKHEEEPVTEEEPAEEEEAPAEEKEKEETETELSLDEQLSLLEEQIEELAAKMLAEGEFGRNYTIPNKKSTPKEIAGSHGHKPHGTSILWPAMYEELRKKGMTKEKAARISNAAWNKKHKAPGNKGPGRFSALVEEFHLKHNQDDHGKRGGKKGVYVGRGRKVANNPWEDDQGPAYSGPLSSGEKLDPEIKRILAEEGEIESRADEKRRADAYEEAKKKVNITPGFRKHLAEIKKRRGREFTVAENGTLEMAMSALEEFRNTHAGRQNRDRRGRFAEHGGLGGLANKYKGPNKGKRLSKSARSGADTGSSGYKGVATTIQERDGSEREKAQWARKAKNRPVGVAEIEKEKAEKRARLEKAKARAAARSGGPANKKKAAAETNAEAYVRKAQERREAQSAREGNQARAAQKAKAAAKQAQTNLDALMTKAKEREAARRGQTAPARISRVEAAEKMFGKDSKQAAMARKRYPNGGPTTQVARPAAETNAEAYVRKAQERREAQSAREGNQARAAQKAKAAAKRSVAETIAERDGSAREKAAWARKAKARPVGEAEIAKEKAARKAKLEAAKARARARSGK